MSAPTCLGTLIFELALLVIDGVASSRLLLNDETLVAGKTSSIMLVSSIP